MKQKLLYIIMCLICALAWSGEAWGQTDLPLTITGDNFSSFVSSESGSLSWDNAPGVSDKGIRLGDSGDGFNWDYKKGVITFKGKPSQITFKISTQSSATKAVIGGNRNNKKWRVYAYEGSSWVEKAKGDDDGNQTVPLNSNTSKIRLEWGWNLSGVFSNVVIKPTHYVKAKAAASTGGTAYTSFTSYEAATETSATANSGPTTNTTDSKTAYYKATASTGYEFLGWIKGTGSYSANGVLSTNTKYDPNISYNSEDSSNPTETTYKAWFGPVFEFSATAIKIFDHGTVSAEVTDSRIVGLPSSLSESTTATFTANPSEGCTFLGWYEDSEHKKFVSSDIEYSTSIENSTVGSKKNLTLYAWFKANQTLTWTNPSIVNIVNGETTIGAAAATASSGLDVTYSSSNGDVASVNPITGDVTGESASVNDVIITASQAGNDEFYPVSATRSFHVINKYQAEFTPSGFTGTKPTIYVGATPTITLADIDTDFTYSSSDSTVVGIAKSGNVITLTALKVGKSTITLEQPNNATHSAVTTTYKITVVKVPNTLAVGLSALAAQVDRTINVTFTDRNNEGTPIVGTITEQSLSSGVNNGTDVITYANGVITAKNAGTAKITFTQAETDRYEGFTSSTYEITVTKLNNPITVTLNSSSATNIRLKYGATATLAYTRTNMDTTPTVTRTSGTFTTLSGSTITAGNAAGTDIYEISQAETYKYEAGYAQFSIRVNNTDEAVGYVLYENAKHDWGTYGEWESPTLTGPADVLTYQAYKNGYGYFFVMASKDNGANYTDIDNPDLTNDDYKTYTNQLEEDVNRVKFETRFGATLHKWMNNIFVTRKTYVRASSNKTALGTLYTDQTASATFTVRYSSTNGGNINIQSSNPHFVPSISSIPVEVNKMATAHNNVQYICGVDGTQTFTVTYTPDPDQLGAEEAEITIGDLFYSQQITLTATAAKRANTLAVVGAQDLKVDDEVANVYSSKNSAATLSYSFSRDGVATFDPTTNKLEAKGAGTTTLTLTQLENEYHYGTTKTVEINVSKYDQTITWDNELTGDDRTLDVGDVLTTNTATANSGLAVTYSSSNSGALAVVDAETGLLEALAGGANIAITATQSGNYKYNEASITRYFTVIQKDEAIVTTTLSESDTNIFPIGSPDITIRCNATLAANALAVMGDPDVVTSTFASNTFTLTAVNEGTVTVTLTRAEDEGYYAVSKTYNIQVIKPVLVLNPSEVPVINYSDYSSVTYSGTLKSGYSTIALPFNTTVETLTGREANDDDWVAQLSVVTYNAKDGYSLYFSKSNAIEANQPYILHLGTAVESPVFTNVNVVAAEEATKNATNGVHLTDWTMHSNYSPTFDMNGYYGVVGEQIKKGTTGSTLKAFHAYITGPAAAGVKAAYLDEDEADAILELLKGEATEPENIYDLQGRQLPRAAKGINIIRNADGTVRKVLRK